jgi:hypothetical protein
MEKNSLWLGGAFHYLYDFGDGWEHRLIVEATGLKETNPCPRLIDGAMACPPEDIGGTVGYTALKVAAAGEKDVYGQELLEAMDGEFAPEALDEDEIADMLEPFQAGFRRLGSTPRKPRPARYEIPHPTELSNHLTKHDASGRGSGCRSALLTAVMVRRVISPRSGRRALAPLRPDQGQRGRRLGHRLDRQVKPQGVGDLVDGGAGGIAISSKRLPQPLAVHAKLPGQLAHVACTGNVSQGGSEE